MQENLHLKIHPGTDPKPFKSEITEIDDNNLILSSSFCFPRGGGQPGDVGTIKNQNGETKFNETFSKDYIYHPVDDINLFKVGDKVNCNIDVLTRNRNSKMHTTQHIVSALSDTLFGAETVGNQISKENTRLDLLFPNRDVFDKTLLEEEFKKTILENSNVNIHEWDRNKIKNHENMRHIKFMDRIPNEIKFLRVVEIEGVDLCPCGGTHVENIGFLDPLIIKSVKSKGAGKLRITY